jgi:hypothetical protein
LKLFVLFYSYCSDFNSALFCAFGLLIELILFDQVLSEVARS